MRNVETNIKKCHDFLIDALYFENTKRMQSRCRYFL